MVQERRSVLDEIALICGAVAAVAQLGCGISTGHVKLTVLTAAITAVAAIFTRQNVQPISKIRRRKDHR